MEPKKPIIIANWKMKLGLNEAGGLAKELRGVSLPGVELVLCPSFVSLQSVGEILRGSKLKLGAQDVFWETAGAYTGEISAPQLREIGCEFVIVGHSERRKYFQETDDNVHQKIKASLAEGLTPIVCVGETFEQRQQGATDYILIKQVTAALEGIEFRSDQQLIVAYEPVWVIGTGQAIEPPEAQNAHRVIRQTLIDLFPLELVNDNTRIVYGGSVDSSNVSAFSQLENTDGVLVGGASLQADEFTDLIKNF